MAGHTGSCICGDQWRFETTDLKTGRIKAVLHPISADWEEKHSAPGQGSLMVATREVTPESIWPHDTGLYISQIIDGERVGRWAGLIEAYDASSAGGATIGIQGIDEYLFHRNIAEDDALYFSGSLTMKQTELAAWIAEFGTKELSGIPLIPVAGDSNITRTRTFNSWEFENVGEAISNLTQVINGVQYYLAHIYNNGFWSTEIRFVDVVGADRGVSLRGDIEGATYGVSVDAKDQATWVYALGEGSEESRAVAIAFDAGNIYPRFVAVPSFDSVSVYETLLDHAKGHIVDHRDPIATPTMTIPGLDPTPENLQIGDIVQVSFDYGLAKFDGLCKVLSIGWNLQDGSPVTRSFTFQPIIRPNDSVRTQNSSNNPNGGSAPATAGALLNIQDPNIDSPSGIAHGNVD